MAQALALVLILVAVTSALNALHGLDMACQQSTGLFYRHHILKLISMYILVSHGANVCSPLFPGILARVVARTLATLRIATAVRTVFVSYLIVVIVRNTVTLAVALLPTLITVRVYTCCRMSSSHGTCRLQLPARHGHVLCRPLSNGEHRLQQIRPAHI